MTTIDRMNDLAVESTNTLIDSALHAQQQGLSLAHAWLNTVEQQQTTTRTLAATWVRQTQEAQRLWAQLAQDSFRNTTENVTRAGQAQVDRMTETVNATKSQGNGADKRAAAAK